MIRTRERYAANEADIRDACESIGHFLAEQGLGQRETERLRLTMERLLRRISERLGRSTPCELTMGRRLGRAWIVVSYPGAAFDPTAVGRESEGDIWSARLLTELGLVPDWSWRRGVNRLTLCPRGRKRNGFAVSAAALVPALLLAFAADAFPAPWREAAERAVFSPLLGAFLNAAGGVSCLALFFSVAAGVCGAGDTAAFAPEGKRMLRRFLARTVVCALAGTAALTALLRPELFAARSALAPARLLPLLCDLVPGDPFSPFLRCDPGGVLVLAAAAGAMLLLLGGRAARVREVAEQCAGVLRSLLECLCRLTPALVFAAALRAARGGLSVAVTALWKPLAAFALCAAAITAAKLTAVCAARRIGPLRLARLLLPPVGTAFLTASAASAFGETMDNCENKLRLPHPLVLNALPVGSVLYVPVAALCFPAALLLLPGGAADLGGLALTALTGAALAMAAPQVPGAYPLCFVPLLARSGLPAEEALVMALLGVVLDPLCAAFSNVCLQLELAAQAERPEQ